ncbi:MAG: sensor domain-containing diguanylate cyclase [Candidatus Melainabacteria bacterium]|nr:sensor domain-containing diguanylate cyclase [Candidatus Melainabacteria bacterium]
MLIWDRDLESFSDKAFFGTHKQDFVQCVEAFVDNYQDSDVVIDVLDVAILDVDLPAELKPVVSYRMSQAHQLVGWLLAAGVQDLDKAQLEMQLGQYPLAQALSNAWEVRELKRENERLRSQYEQLEDSVMSLEEQTRKLIHDVMAKEALHTRKVERDRLVYAISNAVRSSLRIQEVLETSVNQIGQTYRVSHCLLLRPGSITGEIAVYEYHHPLEKPVKELFQTDTGVQFMNAALTRQAPQDLCEPDSDTQNFYNREFLRELGLRSGLLVPLVLRECVLGVIFLQECRESRQWSIDDTALLGSLADQLSVAIENADLHEEKACQARTDGLTGVANRRHFTEVFHLEFERARRYEQPLSLIVADLDYLKKVNDTFGHQAGDEAIKSIARVMRQSSRAIDLAARYGGEEFCLLLPNTDLEMAKQIAERLRRLICSEKVAGPGSVSASIGIASYPNHGSSPDAIFQQADVALYEAKQSGRNRVCVARRAQDT